MIKLSIITINYNNSEGLEKTIRSVKQQSNRDFEFIIIDGGSTDASLGIIEDNKQSITYFVSEKDQGIYNAQNKGIKAAKGEYLLFLNSGDFLCNTNVVKNIIPHLQNNDIVYGNMIINWGNTTTRGIMPSEITLKHLFIDTLWHPISFIKKSLFEKFGLYNESYKIVADYEFFFKTIIVNKCSVLHVDLDIAEFNTSGLSSSAEHKKAEKEERKKVLETYLSAEQIKKLKSELKTKNNSFKGTIKTIIAKFKK